MQTLIRQDRDLRADIIRGFSLWAIFVNHMPGNWLGEVTPKNFMLADATEAFVLLAGYAAGLAYGIVMDRQGWFFAASRVLGRVGTLYVAHIFLFVVFTAQVGFSAATLDAAAYLDELHLDPFRESPYEALLFALLLIYQPSFLNILPLYITILAMFALAMPLMRRPWLMLGASATLWAAARLLDWNIPAWEGGGWFFNPLAWQLLFFLGCAIGYRPPGGGPLSLPWRRWAGILAGCVLLGSAVIAIALFDAWDLAQAVLPQAAITWLAGIDKAALHPARLATIVASAYLIALRADGAAGTARVLCGYRALLRRAPRSRIQRWLGRAVRGERAWLLGPGGARLPHRLVCRRETRRAPAGELADRPRSR
jgi:hypothetical protein